MSGRLDRFATTITDDQPAIESKLITLGMTTEIIMIVQHKDSRLRHRPPIEPGRCQATNASADDYEVIAFLDGPVMIVNVRPPMPAYARPRTNLRDVRAGR